MKRKVIKVVRTCSACPSQWDIDLECGLEIYVRYRGAYFTAERVRQGSIDEGVHYMVEDMVMVAHFPGFDNENYNDGRMTNARMMQLLGDILDFEGCIIKGGDLGDYD